jgi:hypothetical protein
MPDPAVGRKCMAPCGLGVSKGMGRGHAAFRPVHPGPARVHREGQMGRVACGAKGLGSV